MGFASEFIQRLASHEIPVRIIAPLIGITASTSIALGGEDIALRLMEDREIGALLSAGAQPLGPPITFTPHDRFVPRDRHYCVALDAVYPKHIGESGDAEPDPEPDRVRNAAEWALTASRLGWTCGVGMGPLVSLRGDVNSDAFSRISWSATEADPSGSVLSINKEKLDRFLQIYEMVANSNVQRRLEISLRRFRQACLKTTTEDRLIDLLISAEGLFFEGSETELRFKLAVRAALGPLPEDVPRSSVFRFMKDAYSVRSRIVHGSRPIPAKRRRWPRLLDGEKTDSVEDIHQDLEGTIRTALSDAVRTLADGNNLSFDGQLAALFDVAPSGGHPLRGA